jgi:hypothetical protein
MLLSDRHDAMSPDQRQAELATIFATCILRMHLRSCLGPSSQDPEISSDTSADGLDDRANPVLTVSTSVNDFRDKTHRRNK